MKVQRVDGEFIVLNAISGQPMPDQEQFNWLYEAESLAGLNVCTRESPGRKAMNGEAMGVKPLAVCLCLGGIYRPH
jgi:hypothetical protein